MLNEIRYSEGEVVFHKDIKTKPDALMIAISPFLDDFVIEVEYMFSWYWVSDICEDNNISFVLGHALYTLMLHKQHCESMKKRQ